VFYPCTALFLSLLPDAISFVFLEIISFDLPFGLFFLRHITEENMSYFYDLTVLFSGPSRKQNCLAIRFPLYSSTSLTVSRVENFFTFRTDNFALYLRSPFYCLLNT